MSDKSVIINFAKKMHILQSPTGETNTKAAPVSFRAWRRFSDIYVPKFINGECFGFKL